MSPPSPIPRTIHQTWRDTAVPSYLEPFRESWREHHPGWEHRLWTDEDNRRLVAEHYPWFLERYDAYPLAIQRADAVRYFILHRYGGVYADLDCESLTPIGGALGSHACVLGTEPEPHARIYDRPRVVTNALMASVPGHPLWEEVLRALEAHHGARNGRGEPSVLESTGPLMLTDVVESRRAGEVFVHGSDVFCPLLDVTNLDVFGGWNAQGVARRDAYLRDAMAGRWPAGAVAAHYWSGTWWNLRDEKRTLIEAMHRARRDSPDPPPDP